MELHQLRYFVAVAETENFTRAAERSHVSQPSLSQQILKLESEIGHKLFHRLGRKAVLTEAGASLNDVVKATVFIADMNQFGEINEVYAPYFGDHKPARSTVQVPRLPRKVAVEIDLIAVVK